MPVSLSIDGSPMAIESRSSGIEFFAARKSVVALRVDGELRDLATDLATLPEGSVVESVDISSQDGLNILRHSTAHVLAQAVQQVYPDARLGIGPFIEDGFYYDFGNIDAVTPELLRDLEKRMKRIVKEGQTFRRREVSDADAAAELAGQPYKLELVSTKGAGAEGSSVEVGSGGLTMYDNCARDGRVVWTDLCRGPHLPDTRLIGNGFALTKSSAAYWKGDQSGDRLQRIYGTAWASKEDLLAYRERLEEAERRDHRRLGAELYLYSFPEQIGPGLPIFHPKGGVLKRVMEDYVRQAHIDGGFLYVGTPHISKEDLFRTSGHLPYYADGMFPPMDDDGQKYYLKAMNCPMHNLIFASRGRSYRELPLRFFEFGTVYRDEKSGVLQGLTRVRSITQDDSHSYCTPEQAGDEIRHLLTFVLKLLADFGLDDFYLEVSTRSEDGRKKEKFIGTDEQWAKVCLAGTIGGMVINTAGITLAHAMEHPVSGLRNVTHGKGLAAIEPTAIEATYQYNRFKYGRIARILGGFTAEDCAPRVKRLLADLDLNVTLRDLGIEKKDIPWLAQNAQKVSPGNLVNTPGSQLVTTEESLEKLYESML